MIINEERRSRSPSRIGESLVREGMITKSQLKEAFEIEKQKGGFIGKILVELDYLSEEELTGHFVERYGCPYLPLANYEMNPEAIKMVPEAVARKYLLLPVDKMGNLLTVAAANPLETRVVEAVKELTGCKVISYVSTISAIEKGIEFYYGELKE
ncbi:hypothetical protein KAW55_00345 [bacterium]|nr:hypothetical protein [bacterium]MCK4325186.1 hypothetical protein [bacterium]